jgi:hypothetical protein
MDFSSLIISEETIVVLLAFSIGFLLGEGFSRTDYMIQQTEGFKRMKPFTRWVVRSALDVLHHFQHGLALMYASYHLTVGNPNIFAYFIGFGLLTSDVRDFENVVKRLKKFPTSKLF